MNDYDSRSDDVKDEERTTMSDDTKTAEQVEQYLQAAVWTADYHVTNTMESLASKLRYIRDDAQRAMDRLAENQGEGDRPTLLLNTLGIFQQSAPDADRLVATLDVQLTLLANAETALDLFQNQEG